MKMYNEITKTYYNWFDLPDELQTSIVNLFVNDNVKMQLWNAYIQQKFSYNYNWLITEDDNYNTKASELLTKIRYWLNSTEPVFKKLISLYQSEENNLMNSLETLVEQSSSTTGNGSNLSQENDTPRNLNSGRVWDDSHTSFESKNTSENNSESEYTSKYKKDIMYVIDKLDNVRTKYVNIYEEWSNLFQKVLGGIYD